jgi:hypothetical protein
MSKHLALVALLALTACSAVDKRALTNFTPAGATGFTYKSDYGQLFLKDDKTAETQRLTWLAQYVQQNHLCPNGYKIVSRTANETNATAGTLIYKGVCNT